MSDELQYLFVDAEINKNVDGVVFLHHPQKYLRKTEIILQCITRWSTSQIKILRSLKR